MVHCICCGIWSSVFVPVELHHSSGCLCCVGDEYMHHWLYIPLELTVLWPLRISILFYLTNEPRETQTGRLITKSGVKEIPPPEFSSLPMGNFYCQLQSSFEFLYFVYNHKRSNLSVIK
jgi:hypothetical protein